MAKPIKIKKPKIRKGDVVRQAGWRYSDGSIQGKGRLYYVIRTWKEQRYDPVKGTHRLERWAILRSVKAPRWQIQSRTIELTRVRKADDLK